MFLPTVHHVFCYYLIITTDIDCASLCGNSKIMVAKILEVVTEYRQRLRRKPRAPRLSYGRPTLAEDGGPNTMFFTCLFWDEAKALEFLQDVGLLRSKEQSNTCGGDMTCKALGVHLLYNNSISSRTPIGRSAMCHAPPRDPRVVSALTPCLFHQVQPTTIVIIFRLEFGASLLIT